MIVTTNGLVLGTLLIGLLNNVLIAAIFGLTRQVDAFFAATVLPNLFMVLCVDYLGKNFLPVLATARQEGRDSAAAMTSTVVTIVALVAAAVAAVLTVLSGPLFTLLLPGFGDAGLERVGGYFRIMAPAIVLMAITTFHEYLCLYEEQYTRVVSIRMMLPVTNLAAIVLLAPSIAEYALPVGYLAGHALVFVLMARQAAYRFRPGFRIRPHLERRVFSGAALVMSTGLIARTRSIVMNFLASSLGAGAISALAMTAKLTEPLQRGAFTGVRMFMFSRTARLFVEERRRELARLYELGLSASFFVLAPLLWWIALHAETLVALLYGHGEFTPQMSALVAATLLALVPAVLFNGVNQLMSNAFYAMDRLRVPAVIMPAGMLVYVAVAVPLSAVLGTQGLALATTAASICIFFALFGWLGRALEGFSPGRTGLRLLAYAGLAGLVMALAAAALRALGLPASLVAAASLPAGGLAYVAMLGLAHDRVYEWMRRALREQLGLRRVAV